jgi:hypothetical protein
MLLLLLLLAVLVVIMAVVVRKGGNGDEIAIVMSMGWLSVHLRVDACRTQATTERQQSNHLRTHTHTAPHRGGGGGGGAAPPPPPPTHTYMKGHTCAVSASTIAR